MSWLSKEELVSSEGNTEETRKLRRGPSLPQEESDQQTQSNRSSSEHIPME